MNERLIERYSSFAIDIDGVILRGREVIEGAAEGMAAIRLSGKPFLLLTNNASLTPLAVGALLWKHGIRVDPRQVLNPATVGVDWLKARGLAGKRALVLADVAVEEQFSEIVEVVGFEIGEDVDLVIVSRDTRLSYARLKAAADAARSGAELVAMNRDMVMPVADGLEPGTGSILAAVEGASGRKATVLGKPEAPMMEAAARLLRVAPILMIGDQPSSDVAGARRAGWDAAIVLTGVTKDGGSLEPAPDYVFESLAEIAVRGFGDKS